MTTLYQYIQGMPQETINKDDYVLTNCLVIKKHREVVANDLLPTWISQKYMYDIDENLNMPPVITNGIASSYTSIPLGIIENGIATTLDDPYMDGFDRIFGREWK